jgi:hypothetical protein
LRSSRQDGVIDPINSMATEAALYRRSHPQLTRLENSLDPSMSFARHERRPKADAQASWLRVCSIALNPGTGRRRNNGATLRRA